MIDRIVDGRTAVLLLGDEQTQILVLSEELPPGSKEGLWLLVKVEDGILLEAQIDQDKTDEARARISAKRARLLQRTPRRR